MIVGLYVTLADRLQHPPLPVDLLFGENDLLFVAGDGFLHRLEDLLRGRGQPLVDDRSEQLDAGHDGADTPRCQRPTLLRVEAVFVLKTAAQLAAAGSRHKHGRHPVSQCLRVSK